MATKSAQKTATKSAQFPLFSKINETRYRIEKREIIYEND
jgi:hypothetical protein